MKRKEEKERLRYSEANLGERPAAGEAQGFFYNLICIYFGLHTGSRSSWFSNGTVAKVPGVHVHNSRDAHGQ